MKTKHLLKSAPFGRAVQFAVSAVLLLSSCEESLKVRTVNDGPCTLTLNVESFDQVPFRDAVISRASSSPDSTCTKINYAVYSYQGETLTKQQVNQDAGTEGFGTAVFKLEEGTYKIVVLAHSGDGNPTMTAPTKITFNNKNGLKITDTFLYCADVNVTKENVSVNLDLKRVVAMFKLHLEDTSLPEGTSQFRFEYSGGSSTLDAVSGLGCVASKQTETIDCKEGTRDFAVYTFVRGDSDKLKLKVSVLNSSGEVLKEQEFNDVPVTRNYITRYSGKMFKKEILSSNMNVMLETEWEGTQENSF